MPRQKKKVEDPPVPVGITPSPQSEHPNEVPIVVGIGASAGGLEAIQEFFNHIPSDTGACFVVVQHLSPDFRSLMDEILRRHTVMPVLRVDDRTALRHNTVYLLPPRTNIIVDDAHLRVEPQLTDVVIQRPIDVFFDSLAEQRGEASIGLVLSGTGSDGSRGVRAIKEAGGIVLVQDPESAEFDGMPNSAIGTGYADFVEKPGQLAAKVVELLQHPFLLQAARGQRSLPDTDGAYSAILQLLRERAGLDLASYKTGTITRRIERRMSLRHLRDAQDYVQLLRDDTDEVNQLARDCFINVTRFFRDLQGFWALRQNLVRIFVQDTERSEPYRIWIAGCSTGEEAYSIAALTQHCLTEVGARFDFKIFATDLDDAALEIASTGRYPDTVEPDVPRAYFDSMMRRENAMLKVVPSLRNKIVFARHDVLRDPPFPRADLIVCRNLMIYLQPDAQRTVLSRFHFALKRNAVLFLGPSETVEPLGTEFKTLDAKWKIFAKKTDSRLLPTMAPQIPGTNSRLVQRRNPTRPPLEEHPLLRACEHLVQLMAEAGMIISDAGEVVCTFGDVTRWLTLPRGLVSTHLRDMLPDAVADATLLAMRQARSMNGPVRVNCLPHLPGEGGAEGQDTPLDLLHVPGTNGQPGFDVLLLGRKGGDQAEGMPGQPIELDEMARRQIEALERELQSTRENLQSTIEELETTNEEMQSVNEELLASNEELQSTNEELHSVNEELYTVNAEHQQKIVEIASVTDDLENLLKATNIGTVFLDKDLQVRRFTPAAQVAMPLRDQDLGRSILEIVSHLQDVDLGEAVRAVMREGRSREMQARTKSGRPLLVGVHPFLLGSNRVSGTVLSFVDMSRVEDAQRHSLEHAQLLRRITEASGDVFWVAEAATLRMRYLSPAFDRVWGRPRSEVLQDPGAWMRAIHPDDRKFVEREFLARARTGEFSAEYRVLRPDGKLRWVRDRVLGTVTDEAGKMEIVGIAEDVTQRVEVDRLQRQSFEIHRLACDRARVPMLLVRPDGELLWSNLAARRSLKEHGKMLVGRIDDLLAGPTDQDAWQATATRVLAGGGVEGRAPLRLRRDHGETLAVEVDIVHVPGEGGDAGFLVCQWMDLSDQLARERELDSKAKELAVAADTDPLTDLLNRRGLQRLLRQQLALGNRNGDHAMVILVDCDRFKEINDAKGHAAGDAVLRAVAQQMRASLRPSDLVGRVGGDEFLVVLPGTRLAEGAHVGEKLRRIIAGTRVPYDRGELKVTVSVGVVPAPPGEMRVEALMAAAGAPLKQSKVQGRDRVCFLDGEGVGGSVGETDQALEQLLAGDVRVVMQTINDVATGAPVGYELFSRGPQGLAEPTRFFAASRQKNCLEALDLVCLQRCIERALTLEGKGRIHLNLFPSSLLHQEGRAVDAALDRITDRDRFCLELSEQQFVGASSEVRRRIDVLRQRGFHIALDDVGFGHSALETLLAVDPEVVKIDKQMIAGIDQDEGARRVVERLVALFQPHHNLVIAEGVERESQRRALLELGVPMAQGYLWSRPDEVPSRN